MTIAMTEKAPNKNDTCDDVFQKWGQAGGGRYGLDTIMIYNVTKLIITMARNSNNSNANNNDI